MTSLHTCLYFIFRTIKLYRSRKSILFSATTYIGSPFQPSSGKNTGSQK